MSDFGLPCWVYMFSHAGIGSLLSAWLTQHPGLQLVLAGRAGHTRSSTLDLIRSDAPVTIIRCNVATATEAKAALCDYGALQLASLMHAGGVLQDGVLSKQTAGSVRYVWSPKLCFMAHLAVAISQQALHVVNLLSSVSAFLGTPGQANYAAANSALNAWAEIFQQRGIGGKRARRVSLCQSALLRRRSACRMLYVLC